MFSNIKERKQLYSHLFFWLVIFILMLILDNKSHGFFFSFVIELINLLFYAAVVYFNFLYLIPNYLNGKNFLLYSGLLLLAALIVSPIKVLFFYVWHSYFPEIQAQLISDQFWYFISTFVFAGASTIVKITSDWASHQRDMTTLRTQTMQSELRFLKSQINPHFLFNTLNSLYALTLKKSDKAPEIVIKLSEMMRYMLYECNERRVSLEKEVNYIKNYLDLERLRHGDHVDIKFQVRGNLNQQKIAPLMFIPFLENSFKHGLNRQIDKSYVYIKLEIQEGDILFEIENSKPQVLPLQTHKASGGIGLVNIKKRLNILYPKNYDLKTLEQPDSYKVELKLKLSK